MVVQRETQQECTGFELSSKHKALEQENIDYNDPKYW